MRVLEALLALSSGFTVLAVLIMLVGIGVSMIGSMDTDKVVDKSMGLAVIGLALCLAFGTPVYLLHESGPKIELLKSEWSCSKSHEETVTMYVMVGKVMMPQVSTQTICDVYTRGGK